MTAITKTKINRADLLMVGIAYAGFIALGIPGTLLNIAWSPYMRETFGLPLDSLGLLLIASTAGYFFASFGSGRIINRLGVGALLLASSLLGVVGLLGYALSPSWVGLIVFALVSGSAGGLMDAGMNIYFAATYGPRLMNWLHACFGVGATIGPLLMTTIIQSGQSWRWGYALAAAIYGALAITFALTRGRWRTVEMPTGVKSQAPVRARSVLLLPAVWLGVAVFFAYGGLEVAAGQWSSTLFTQARQVPAGIAERWVSLYWGSFTIGRFLYGAIANRIQVVTVVRLCMLGALVGTAIIWWNPTNEIGFLGLALVGFAQAPVFPLLVTNTQERLGPRLAPHAIGFQIAAASLGIALVPALAGVLAQNVGVETIAPFLVVIAVVIIALYEFSLRLKEKPNAGIPEGR